MVGKDYQKGMVAGAKPFEEKFQKQAEAVEVIGKRIEEKMENISSVQNVILDDLSAKEKKELYDLNTNMDIGELEDAEKELLMAVLYTLSDMLDEVNMEQQAYIRSVKKYLNSVEMQILSNLSCIENIDSKKTEKAIMQCMMEFLFLRKCDHSYLEKYENVFEYFSVKNNEVLQIKENIDIIFKATGAEGLAEKYGCVEKVDECCQMQENGDNVDNAGYIPSEIADRIIQRPYAVLPNYIVWADDKVLIVWDKTKEEEYKITVDSEFGISKIWGIGANEVVYDGKDCIVIHNIESRAYKRIEGCVSNIIKEDHFCVCDVGIVYKGIKGLEVYEFQSGESKIIYIDDDKTDTVKTSIFCSIGTKIYFAASASGIWVKRYLLSGEDVGGEVIFCYDMSEKKLERVAYNSNKDSYTSSIIEMSYSDPNLYCTKRNAVMDVISLETETYGELKKSIEMVNGKHIKFYEPYVIYVKEKTNFPVYVYDIRSKEEKVASNGCGHVIRTKKLLRKEEISYYANSCYVVGNWLYVDKGKFMFPNWHRVDLRRLDGEVKVN